MLIDHGGAKKVESEQGLRKELEIILEDKEIRQHMGEKSFEVFLNNSGAVQRIIRNLECLDIV